MLTEEQILVADILGTDDDLRYIAYTDLLEQTKQEVPWAYDVWDDLVKGLAHENNHARTICAQLLCSLAKSDPEQRILHDLEAVVAVTRDPRFVTARHTLQALWKIALPSPEHRAKVIEQLSLRFTECSTEKNSTLIRYDIIVNLQKILSATSDPLVKEKALELIALEEDKKYKKKYLSALT